MSAFAPTKQLSQIEKSLCMQEKESLGSNSGGQHQLLFEVNKPMFGVRSLENSVL